MHPAHWIRASDADREAVVAHLSAATAEGRLTLEEFSDRARQAYVSRTWGELARLVHDLPAPSIAHPRPAVTAQPATTSGSALPSLALIFGVVSLSAGFCVPVGAVAGVVGIVLGILALYRGVSGHRGAAVAAVTCGSLGVALNIAMGVFFVIGY